MEVSHSAGDRSGRGTNLVYAIDSLAAEQQQKKEPGQSIPVAVIDKMVAAIAKRINPSGAEEVTVRRVGNDRIEIIIPGADPDLVEQKKRLITKLGSLEFGIVANDKDHQSTIEKAMRLSPTVNELRSGDRVIASWRQRERFRRPERSTGRSSGPAN